MRVKHCPRCGSDEISKSSGSAEYSSWVRYSCEDCSWGYKKGSGMGNGSRSSGTGGAGADAPSNEVRDGAQDVYNISGWTENVIDFIDKMENVDGMIREIESVEP